MWDAGRMSRRQAVGSWLRRMVKLLGWTPESVSGRSPLAGKGGLPWFSMPAMTMESVSRWMVVWLLSSRCDP